MNELFIKNGSYVQSLQYFNFKDSRKDLLLKELQRAENDLIAAKVTIREIVQEILKMGADGDDIADQVFLTLLNTIKDD